MRKLAVAAKVVVGVAAFIVLKMFLFPALPRGDFYGVDGPTTKAAALKIIPIGSPIGFAKAATEERGFHCEMMYNQGYAGYDPSNPRHLMSFPAADFLWCDSGERWAGMLIDERWQIIFVMKDGAVESVTASVGLTGL
jgi:hypothetical protein